MRTLRWHYIRYNNGAEELYDRETDPYEWTNLAARTGSETVLQQMRQRLIRHVDVSGTP